MNKESISDRQGIILVTMFIIGTSIIISTGIGAKKDLWLANILAVLMALPMILIYARLHYIFPEKDMFQIIEVCFGSFIGKGIELLYIWFAFHIGALILINLGWFINTISLPETPKTISMIFILMLGIWGAKEGIEVLGRWAASMIFVIMSFLLITRLLLIPEMNILNIRPVLAEGLKPVMKGAFETFTFPLTETVIFTMVFSRFREKRSPYKIYMFGFLIGGITILLVSVTNILVIGVDNALSMYFPSYRVVSRLNIGDIISRIEIVPSAVFLMGSFIKLSICMLAVSKGISSVWNLADYRFIITPAALLMLNLSLSIYDSLMEMIEFIGVSPYYKLPFEVILPIVILLFAEKKKNRVTA
ncbi:MAG: GerAB/ArcD/ProY family transporter [Bacillota bacterium]